LTGEVAHEGHFVVASHDFVSFVFEVDVSFKMSPLRATGLRYREFSHHCASAGHIPLDL
jgi:hypothetical protein